MSIITEDMQQEETMNPKARILALAAQTGIVRPRDVEAEGIPREYLLRLHRAGEVVRVGRGLYALPAALTSESVTLVEVARRVPNAVVCLITALAFHNLTTQVSNRVWLAIENKKWEPEFEYPPLELVRLTGRAFSFGIEEHDVDRVTVKVYSPAKTVADCFKFRNKVGLDVALEALRETLSSGRATVDELWEAARVCRVTNVIRPYLEAIA